MGRVCRGARVSGTAVARGSLVQEEVGERWVLLESWGVAGGAGEGSPA